MANRALHWLLALVSALLLLAHLPAKAATYINASVPYNWIDESTHTKVGYNTTPYKFNGGGDCGTTPPVLDDVISDLIPLGFSFVFGTTPYTSLRIQTNGRLQFGNTTCSFGTANIGPPQTYPNGYPAATMNGTMKIFGVDLDLTNLVDQPNYPSASTKTTCLNIATCYISYATLGTAPSRQFVVTWHHVPEWVSASQTSGSFDVQVIVYENGTFVYQYGAINHGGTGTAQVGWQLTTSDYGVLTFGASTEPPPGTAILFYPAFSGPLAEYQFEQGAWSSGDAGQVLDSSVNGFAGAAAGSAQEIATGKVCRGAAIPANTTAAAIDAIKTGVRFSDSNVNMLGQGTVMFWYKSAAAWSGTGALAAQLLDAAKVSGQWFSLTKTAAGTLYFEVTDSTGGVRSAETPVQSFAAGTWVHVAISWNFNALPAANSDKLSITVNGGTPVTASFTTSGSLNASLDYLSMGDNPSGFTGTKGTVNSANGVMDELRVYNYELNQGQILASSSETHGCPSFSIHHLELRHASWSGVSCAVASMTVVACANAACTSLYTSGMQATLSSTGAATLWDSSTGGAAIVIGATRSSATKNFYTAAGSATFDVTGTGAPVLPSNAKLCNGSGGACTWTSSNAGLVITPPDSGFITGGKPAPVSVQAVQSSGPTPGAACVPVQGLSGAGLKTWTAPVSPASFAATSTSAGVTVGGRPQAANASAGTYATLPLALPGSSNVTGLNFDATATTTLWLKHMDTGQFMLNATLDVAATSTTPALTLSGTGSVSSLPVGYGVTASGVLASNATQTACAAGASAACNTAAGGNARVASAGDSFGNTVSAALWTVDGDTEFGDNPVAPSYAGTVTLAPLLAAPMGGNLGTLATTSVALSAGTATVAAQRWTQSGAVRVAASGTYLTRAISGQSVVLGRFSPRNFVTTVDTQGCGSFTYSGQPIRIVTVRAMDGAAVPSATANYTGDFARTVTLSDGNGATSGSFSANSIAAAGFSAGTGIAAPVYTFNTAKTAPLGVKLRASDAEVNSSGAAEGSAEIRSGRLYLQNVYGSELLALPVPLSAQYWDGSRYTTNTADNCTVVPASSIVMGNYLKNLQACETQLSPTGNLSFAAGMPPGTGLVLSKPGMGNAGAVDLSITTGAVASGNTCVGPAQSSATAANLPWFSPAPRARASFGVYKSPIIYGRENY